LASLLWGLGLQAAPKQPPAQERDERRSWPATLQLLQESEVANFCYDSNRDPTSALSDLTSCLPAEHFNLLRGF